MEIIKTASDEVKRFKNPPLKHQLEYLNKRGREQYFALLAEQGTGKTYMIINNTADLWGSGDLDAMLIFAPNGVHENWTRLEIPKHMPDWVRFRSAAWIASPNKKEKKQIEDLYSAEDGELRIFAMNWDSLQTKKGVEAATRFATCSRRLMIVADESDSIKNPSALRTKELMKLKKYSHWRRIMSGTPINNAPFDAFSQFSFLDEHILQTTSYYAFKAEYSELLDGSSHIIQHIVNKKVKMDDSNKILLSQKMNELYSMIFSNGRDELIMIMNSAMEHLQTNSHEGVLKKLEELKSCFSPASSKRKEMAMNTILFVEKLLGDHLKKVSSAFNPNRLPQIVEKDDNGRPKYRNLDKLSRLIAPHSFR
ncbi:MAG TPA: SNF2-related protein, partial [Methanosarcina sp.]|nr:SNF2-related protein [Methanosarcina sp.]